MKRVHSDENMQELDDDDSSLSVHSELDNCENELPKKLKSEVMTNAIDNDGHTVQSKEITESRDATTVQCTIDDTDVHESHCEHDVSTESNISKLTVNESTSIEQLSERKDEMLLEAISSDDIAIDSEEDGILDSDEEENKNDYTDDVFKDFVPSLFQATPLRSIQDPSLSLFEYIHRKIGDEAKCEEVTELMDCLDYLQTKNVDINEKWVDTAERAAVILPKTLCHILSIPEYCHKLFSMVNVALDFDCALKEHVLESPLVLRHLKVGLKLIEVLSHYNEDLSEHLIKHHQIHNKLIHLFFVEHMCLSFKLNILRALDSSLNGSEPIRLFLYHAVFDDLNGYQTLLKILSIHQRPRVYFLVTSILRKIHFYELIQKLNTEVNILDSNPELLLEDCLAEITTTYIKAPILMGCPKRFLQARAQFELSPSLTHYNVYPTIYRLFDDLSLISCITKLLNKPNTNGLLEENILKFLESLMNCDHGLKYLASRYKEMNELIKVLNKINGEFNLILIYKLKVLALIDYLSYFWECNLMHNFKLDQMESVDILHDMFLLTQCPIGKCAVVNVLTMGDNLDVILNFFKYIEQLKPKNDDLYILYSMDLMKIVLENKEEVNYLKKYGTVMYELACKHNCLNDLIPWTFPAMKHSTFFHDDVSELCSIVKNNMDNCLSFNKTLITSLRILKYLGVPNDKTVFKGGEDFIELKYKYINLQMYSFDMLENLLTIVSKICDSYKQPSVNIWKLTGDKGKSMISIIRPSMTLIRCMITLLIQSRGIAFKDSSPVKILLNLYNLMHHVPDYYTIREDANKVIKDINKTLKAYIEIKIGCSIAKELLVWTLSCPTVFFPGLLLLGKLLPSPLPIQTVKPLEESLILTMVSYRNMWLDHLALINNDLVDLITVLSVSSLLSEPLKCVCIKVADLSMSMCLLVTKSLLDVLIKADNNDCFNRCLNLVTKLCNNKEYAIIKTAVLQTINEENAHEIYEKFVHRLCENIKINKQVNSLMFVQCLCDSDIVLSGNHSENSLPKDSVPNRRVFNNILNALLSLLESNTDLPTLSLIIETCIVIVKNEYGFYQFTMALNSFSEPFNNIFNNLLQQWDKDDVHCVNTLMLTEKLLKSLTKNNVNGKRVLFIGTSQLRDYLNWSNDVKDHPICSLKEKIQEVDSVNFKHLTDLIELLNEDQVSVVELIEPHLAAVDLLTPTFKDRPFYVLNSNGKKFKQPEIDLCVETLEDLEESNVEEVVSHLPDFNIKDEINNLFKIEECPVQPEPIVPKQEPVVLEKKENTTHISVVTTTPIRPKVFSRLGTIQRPMDAFRNRSPNTSRPPSLHVDDFVAMETRSARQQPRYKSPIQQPIQDLNIRLRERQMAYERTYSLLSPYKSHLSLHNWHAQFNALTHLRADYHQSISSRHLELQRQSLIAEWRQLRVEAALRKQRAYTRR